MSNSPETIAQILAESPKVQDSRIYWGDEGGEIRCVKHAGHYLGDAIKRAEQEGRVLRSAHTALGMWHRMTKQEVAFFRYAIRDMPDWVEHPCDACRDEAARTITLEASFAPVEAAEIEAPKPPQISIRPFNDPVNPLRTGMIAHVEGRDCPHAHRTPEAAYKCGKKMLREAAQEPAQEPVGIEDPEVDQAAMLEEAIAEVHRSLPGSTAEERIDGEAHIVSDASPHMVTVSLQGEGVEIQVLEDLGRGRSADLAVRFMHPTNTPTVWKVRSAVSRLIRNLP